MSQNDNQHACHACGCIRSTESAEFFERKGFGDLFCSSVQEHHCRAVWDCCFEDVIDSSSVNNSSTFAENRELLAEKMLSILPPFLGGDVRDWEKGDESETMVHNMVSTSMVNGSEMPINLSQLATLLPCSTYDRKRFAAITIRIDHPRCTALLFTSGKLVITGVKSWYECLLASLCIAHIISGLFVHAKYYIVNCDVQNIVAHAEIKLQPNQILNIQRMYESMAMECTYQRNMFPGLIYRGKDAPVVLLCFYSGKVVLTGGKTIRDIEWGWNMLWKIVKKFVQ